MTLSVLNWRAVSIASHDPFFDILILKIQNYHTRILDNEWVHKPPSWSERDQVFWGAGQCNCLGRKTMPTFTRQVLHCFPCGKWQIENSQTYEVYQNLIFCLFGFLFFPFFKTGFLCVGWGWPGTHSVDQSGLELRNPPASASQVLGIKVCATTAWPAVNSFKLFY